MRTDGAAMLTATDIGNIRRYVKTKYADLPSHRHAEIVADAMQRVVLKGLPDYPEEVKRKLAAELLRDVVAIQQRPVGAEQIFALCLSLNNEDPELLAPFHKWTEQRLHMLMDQDTFREFIAEGLRAKTASQSGYSPWHTVRALAASLGARDQSVPVADMTSVSGAGNVVELPKKRRSRLHTVMYAALSLLLVAMTTLYGWQLAEPEPIAEPLPPVQMKPVKQMLPAAKNELPSELQYAPVDRALLTAYLNSKKSILSDAPYMDAILSTAKEFDIHPLFLFAITGQEQGFVPRDHKQAKKIANNPFNVYHSWEDYNTTIKQSAAIAARTITRLSKDKPADVDAFAWINREYAEDPNWSNGVRTIFNTMKRHIETDTQQ